MPRICLARNATFENCPSLMHHQTHVKGDPLVWWEYG